MDGQESQSAVILLRRYLMRWLPRPRQPFCTP